jgi:hypothetical protein
MTQYLRFGFDNIHQRVPGYIETSHEVRGTWRIKLLTSSGHQKMLLEVDCNVLNVLSWIVERHTRQSMEYWSEVRDGKSIAQAISDVYEAHYNHERRLESREEWRKVSRYDMRRSIYFALTSARQNIPIYIGYTGRDEPDYSGEISCLCQEKKPDQINKKYPLQRVSYEMGDWRYYFFFSEYLYHLREITRSTLFKLQKHCIHSSNLETITHLLTSSETMVKMPEIITPPDKTFKLSRDEIIIMLDYSIPVLVREKDGGFNLRNAKRYGLHQESGQIFEFTTERLISWRGKPVISSEIATEARDHILKILQGWHKHGRIDDTTYQNWLQAVSV